LRCLYQQPFAAGLDRDFWLSIAFVMLFPKASGISE